MNNTEMKEMNKPHYYCLKMKNVTSLHRKMIVYKLNSYVRLRKQEFSIKCILVDTNLMDFYVNVGALLGIKIICTYHLSFKHASFSYYSYIFKNKTFCKPNEQSDK